MQISNARKYGHNAKIDSNNQLARDEFKARNPAVSQAPAIPLNGWLGWSLSGLPARASVLYRLFPY